MLSRITLPGSLYLGIVAVLPNFFFSITGGNNQNFPFGGTAVLIMVGVAPRHGEADREPADAAQLRRVPALVRRHDEGEQRVRLVLVGPPGAGKGTQAEFIAEHFDIPKISTGDIFRSNVSGGTDLGKLAKKYMDAGDLVPDEVTNAMVRDRLGAARRARPDSCSTDSRATSLRPTNSTASSTTSAPSLDVVLDLEVDHDEVVRRLSGRRLCKKCGHVWHVEFDPPKVEDVCDKCGGELYHRDDD